MIQPVKRVEMWVGVERTNHPELCGQTLCIQLSNGEEINIELFERDGGPEITIRSDWIYVLPWARNTIKIGATKWKSTKMAGK